MKVNNGVSTSTRTNLGCLLANVNIYFFVFVNLLCKLFSAFLLFILSKSSVLLQHFGLFYSIIKNG